MEIKEWESTHSLHREMTARTARVLYDTTKTITVVSGIIGGVLTFIAAGISDIYTLVGLAVQGDYDFKIMHIAFFIMGIAVLGIFVMDHALFDAMYDLERVPVKYSEYIECCLERNQIFDRQIREALDKYYNFDWGMVDRWDSKINDDAVENGYDRVRGIYQTIFGKVFIVTDSEIYATTIYSEKEYLKEINY